jgi:hypothetical protein
MLPGHPVVPQDITGAAVFLAGAESARVTARRLPKVTS